MNLLIVTQAVDQNHPVLGFFHDWVAELSSHFEHIEVICLSQGVHVLPSNVRVHSLGKEIQHASSLMYAIRFLRLMWKLRKQYDAVFVHMNQEYILLAGIIWKILGKRVYLWRNHYAGSHLTDIAATLSTNVFCTSRHSYTAKYRKTIFMPVGVDTKKFIAKPEVARKPGSILFLARMSASKNPLMLIEALEILRGRNVAFTARFVGSPVSTVDHDYYRKLIKRGEYLSCSVEFLPGVSREEAVHLYRTHQIFVNTSPSGMFDKTLFEAASTGCLVLALSEDYREMAGHQYSFRSATELAERLETYLGMQFVPEAATPLQKIVQSQNLQVLTEKLARQIQEPHTLGI